MTSTVTGRGKPKNNYDMDEGEQSFLITKVTGLPRAEVTNVKVEFVNEDGAQLENNYDLDVKGGYAAFYWLVKNGLGVDLDVGEQFDLANLEGRFVLLDIIHKPREAGGVFNNIKSTVGPGTPFGDAASGDDWDDED
ncbi:MAG: hypothetical protein JRC93_04000 [Deltaproteobacteria bacterium]|nr:hypothetical protein [Deltaproteobacteria bacterium]